MIDYLPGSLKAKVKALAIYQIIGGSLGVLIVAWGMVQIGFSGVISMLFFSFAGLLYLFSIYCGRQLLKGDLMRAFRLSSINQVLQAIDITIAGLTYRFASGILLSAGIKITSRFEFSFNINLSTFQFFYNRDNTTFWVGLNFAAIYCIYLIGKLKHAIQYNQYQIKEAQSPMLDGDLIETSKIIDSEPPGTT